MLVNRVVSNINLFDTCIENESLVRIILSLLLHRSGVVDSCTHPKLAKYSVAKQLKVEILPEVLVILIVTVP